MASDYLHPNYGFILSKAKEVSPNQGRLLDVGCGKGDIVVAALDKNWDAFGIEHFSHGSGTNIRSVLKSRNLFGIKVFEYDGIQFPFTDAYFDIVISNQVLEHVPDVNVILGEVSRVLRPGGKFICVFPTKDSFREGHAGVLFAHWLPQSWIRVIWLFAFRSLGFGRLKKNKTRIGWAKYFNNWLSQNTFYQSEKEISYKISQYFDHFERAEAAYIDYRLDLMRSPVYALLRSSLPRSLKAFFCRKFGSSVFVCTV